MMNNDHQVSKYDRLYGGLEGLRTKPSVVKNSETLTGKTETYIVQTIRNSEMGDYVFIEVIDDSTKVTRVSLPPKVADIIVHQRESLTSRSRSAASKRLAQERKERGELPAFLNGNRKRKEQQCD
jgi:hypothetical protein